MTDNTNIPGAQYTYDAFISYRHNELDKFVAETLHEQLESYKLPGSLKKKMAGQKTKINRVFRDKDELPLTSNLEDPIIKALASSEFLIVICSPRLKESIWCKREIETFIQMHGREHVLAVLIEGEPEESFPEELLYVEETVWNYDGTASVVKRPLEPLAADFRGATKKDIKKAMKEEILRLLAPMFGVNYDDLKRRHRERRLKRIISVASFVAIAGIAFGTYSTVTAIKIHKQSVKIKEQADELELQAQELERQNNELKKKQAENLAKQADDMMAKDDRLAAVNLAYGSVTSYEGVELPVTPEGQRALINALGIYDAGGTIQPIRQVKTPGIVNDVVVSANKEMMLTYDSLDNLILWNVSDAKQINQITGDTIISYGFLGDNAFYYLPENGELTRVDIASLETKTYTPKDAEVGDVLAATATLDGDKLVARTTKAVYILNVDTFDEEKKCAVKSGLIDAKMFVGNTSDEVYMISDSFIALSVKKGEPLFEGELPKGDIRYCCSDNEFVYVLSYDYESNINGKTVITAYGRETGEISWSEEKVSILGTSMYYSGDGKKKNLLVIAGEQMWMLNAKNGKTIHYFLTEGEGLYCDIMSDGSFLVYDSNGLYNSISRNTDEMMIAAQAINCTELSILKLASTSFLGVPKNDNRVILYNYRKNGDTNIYDGDVAACELEAIMEGDVLVEWGRTHNLEQSALAFSVLEVPEAKLAFISYKDNTLEVYKTDTMELLNRYEDIDCANLEYHGKLNDMYYIKGIGCALIFDSEGSLCGEVPGFAGLTSDKKQLVIYGRDDSMNMCTCSIPAYTLDEIKEKAKKYLDNNQ